LSSSSRFPLHAVFFEAEAGSIGSWPRQTFDEAATNRFGDRDEHDWDRAVCLL
jgi:hypothetical protein